MSTPISFACPFCEKEATAPEGTEGKWCSCRGCKERIQVPHGTLITPSQYLELAARPKPAPGPSECPYCHVAIDPRPTRAKKCKSCGEKLYVRQGTLYTAQNARAFDEQFGNPLKWMNREEKFHYYRHYFACQFRMNKQLSRDIIGVRVIAPQAPLCCGVCRRRHKAFVPFSTGKLEDLPPFPDCDNEDFCPCILTAVFRDPAMNKLMDIWD